MAASITHHIFANEVLRACDGEVREKLKGYEDLFLMFGKSFDVLFFIKPYSGSYAHNHNVNKYFKNIIKYIKENKEESSGYALAYLYGSICHYVLDSIVHPYVYYKTGKYSRGDKKTKKYKGKHDYLEYMIDAIYYEDRYNKPIYKVKVEEILPKLSFSRELINILDYVYFETFGYKNYGTIIKKGYRNFRFIFKHGMCSRWGIKKGIYKFLDMTNILRLKASNICYYIKKLDNSVLNLEHKKWHYPIDKKLSYHYSFNDLYDIAIVRAVGYIRSIDKVLGEDENKMNRVLREIGNLGYSTGKNCDRNYVMKYFEY